MPDLIKIRETLTSYRAWSERRQALSAAEAAPGVHVNADDWHASDDEAVALLQLLAAQLEQAESAAGPRRRTTTDQRPGVRNVAAEVTMISIPDPDVPGPRPRGHADRR